MSTSQNGAIVTNDNDGKSGQESSSSTIQLDVPKLHSLPSEQQDLFLFTFAVRLESHVDSLSYEERCAQQSPLIKEIFQVIELSSPAPSKAVRNNLGRAFASILGKGNRKTLFESVNQLVGLINAGKGEKDLQSKHAAVYCLGEVYKAAGDSAINLSSVACSSLLRLLKSAQNHAGLRAAILRALSKTIEIVRGSIEEAIARDVWKQARTLASNDKAALVQARACGCLEQLIKCTNFFDTINEFDALKSAVWKACESHVLPARHAAASCLATILVKAYSEKTPSISSPKPKKAKKANRTQSAVLEENGDEIPRPASPSNAKKTTLKVQLSLADILRQLSSQYVRTATSKRVRASIAHCYTKILFQLGPSVVEGAYSRIVEHLLNDLLSNPFIAHDRYRQLLTRKFVHNILAGCIGSQVLGESSRLNAARALINDVLRNYPQVIKEAAEPSKHALVGALDALTALIGSLGSVFHPLGDACRDALIQVLQHPSYTVQIHAANCLRAFVLACPQQLLSCASLCMNSVNRELGLLNTARQSPRRCIGYANGLAAVLSTSPSQPLYSSLEISSRVLSTATELLKSSSHAELRAAETQVQVAWILIGGLMALGPSFVKIHISQFLLLWRNALPKPLTKENTAQRQLTEITYLTHVRECTLGSILLFLEFNSRLVTVDVAKRIASMLQHTFEYLDNLADRKNADEQSQRNNMSLTLQDLTCMVLRRVLQCYTKLISSNPHASGEILAQSNLITLAVTLFADPENHRPGTLGSSIANAAGTFESIWDVTDNLGFGVTGLVRSSDIKPLAGEHIFPRQQASKSLFDSCMNIDDAVSHPWWCQALAC